MARPILARRPGILEVRERRVILDMDLADLYGVTTKALNQQVRRNRERFPPDFAFQLAPEEWENLRSKIATSSWGGRRTPPLAFTEILRAIRALMTPPQTKRRPIGFVTPSSN